jgi:divalent metal cation (Fe/Co/Zn/Cd) transporter
MTFAAGIVIGIAVGLLIGAGIAVAIGFSVLKGVTDTFLEQQQSLLDRIQARDLGQYKAHQASDDEPRERVRRRYDHTGLASVPVVDREEG